MTPQPSQIVTDLAEQRLLRAQAKARQGVAQRGFHVAYRGAATPCPGCSGTNWMVGRFSAECGFCATALPLEGVRL